MNRVITIGGINFKLVADAEKHIREILSRYGHMQKLQGDDEKFVLDILDRHPNYDAIVREWVRYIVVEHLFDRYSSRRFLAVRMDGSVRDFTWRHALVRKTPRMRLMKACRTAIYGHIKEFRDLYFRGTALSCEVSGLALTPANSDVDHAAPDTFQALVDRWIVSVNLTPEAFIFIPSPVYRQPDAWERPDLEAAWKAYHLKHARLRVIHSTANRSTLRKANP